MKEILPLSNLQIERMLKNKCKLFRGVFSSNNIPLCLKEEKMFSIICNLSKSTEEGSHFITILKVNSTLLYIDPLGSECFNSELNEFMMNQNCKLLHSVTQIQDNASITCGYFCILFCIDFENPHKSRIFYKKPFLHKNDMLCMKFILSTMRNQEQ